MHITVVMGCGTASGPEFRNRTVPVEPVAVTLRSYPYPCYTLTAWVDIHVVNIQGIFGEPLVS
jgi:hypothetical protein